MGTRARPRRPGRPLRAARCGGRRGPCGGRGRQRRAAVPSRKKPPFGVGQVGKAFRNEITPGNFIFRTREFEQMEMEFLCAPGTDDKAGSPLNLLRWLSARTIKETFVPPTDYRYPHMKGG
ncbi:MAG: hypothetical protein LOY04_08055 [Rhodococcus ruber]|nr:hypothetical protein [Rhodococcus ruber]